MHCACTQMHMWQNTTGVSSFSPLHEINILQQQIYWYGPSSSLSPLVHVYELKFWTSIIQMYFFGSLWFVRLLKLSGLLTLSYMNELAIISIMATSFQSCPWKWNKIPIYMSLKPLQSMQWILSQACCNISKFFFFVVLFFSFYLHATSQ